MGQGTTFFISLHLETRYLIKVVLNKLQHFSVMYISKTKTNNQKSPHKGVFIYPYPHIYSELFQDSFAYMWYSGVTP